jgi:hypothetical protein
MSKEKFKIKGRFQIECFDKEGKLKWTEDFTNMVVDEGLNDILDVYLSAASQSTNWYVGLKGSNQTIAAGWNAAGIGTQFTEFVDYNEATRPAWSEGGVASKQITNSGSPAEFNINSSGTVYGAFIINNSTKGGSTGKMWCISDFDASRSVASSDLLKVTYTITAADA